MIISGYKMVCNLLNEKLKSKPQQQFCGMGLITKKENLKNPYYGDLNNTNSRTDTKREDLPEIV